MIVQGVINVAELVETEKIEGPDDGRRDIDDLYRRDSRSGTRCAITRSRAHNYLIIYLFIFHPAPTSITLSITNDTRVPRRLASVSLWTRYR